MLKTKRKMCTLSGNSPDVRELSSPSAPVPVKLRKKTVAMPLLRHVHRTNAGEAREIICKTAAIFGSLCGAASQD